MYCIVDTVCRISTDERVWMEIHGSDGGGCWLLSRIENITSSGGTVNQVDSLNRTRQSHGQAWGADITMAKEKNTKRIHLGIRRYRVIAYTT
jgi:hypothetical protein